MILVIESYNIQLMKCNLDNKMLDPIISVNYLRVRYLEYNNTLWILLEITTIKSLSGKWQLASAQGQTD